MSDELELKYAVHDPAALEAWLDREFPPAGTDPGWRTSRMTDRYFDTADRALERAGYGARLRRVDGQVVLTVKSDVATTGAVHHRQELEVPAANSLRPERWPQSEVRALIERVTGGRRLIERFALRQRRRERRHRLSEERACLLSIDRVAVVAGRQSVAELRELEVELLAGDKSLLSEMGRLIEGSGLVTREPRSKMALAALLTNR